MDYMCVCVWYNTNKRSYSSKNYFFMFILFDFYQSFVINEYCDVENGMRIEHYGSIVFIPLGVLKNLLNTMKLRVFDYHFQPIFHTIVAPILLRSRVGSFE